jgi:maleate isomerase
MYGWKARVGHVSASRGDAFVYEFYRMMPEEFMLLNTTGKIRQLADDHIKKQIEFIEEAAMDLEQAGADVVIAGGSPMFTLMGYGSDVEVSQHIQSKLNVPFTLGITAEMESMRKLEITKPIVVTPHRDDMNERLAAFLGKVGFEVKQVGGLGILKNADIGAQHEYVSYRLARKLFCEAPDADGIFLHCPRWPTIRTVPLLEEELGIPVVSTSQAMIWQCLKLIRTKVKLDGWGRLMETLNEAL